MDLLRCPRLCCIITSILASRIEGKISTQEMMAFQGEREAASVTVWGCLLLLEEVFLSWGDLWSSRVSVTQGDLKFRTIILADLVLGLVRVSNYLQVDISTVTLAVLTTKEGKNRRGKFRANELYNANSLYIILKFLNFRHKEINLIIFWVEIIDCASYNSKSKK